MKILSAFALLALFPSVASAQIMYDTGLCTASEWLTLETILRHEGVEAMLAQMLAMCHGSYFNAMFHYYVWAATNWFATEAEVLNWWFGYVFSQTGG